MNKQRTTILLIDDHAILREGYQQLLESAGFEVIGQSGNAEEGIRRLSLCNLKSALSI